MTRSVFFRIHCLLAFLVALAVLVANSPVRAEDRYPFVAQQAGNRFDRYICAGLAGGIECLEEGSEIEGVESSEDLAVRLWNRLTDSSDEFAEFVYYSDLRLRDGTRVPIQSKAAIEEIGFLIQEEYRQLLDTKLWQAGVDPDPDTPEGRTLLRTRQKYLDLSNNVQEYSVTSEHELKYLFDEEEDEDGLVALSGRGHRLFEQGTPQKVIDHRNVKIDPKTGKLPPWVPSYHAFLLTYDKNANQIYVYDSDDPRDKWPVTVRGYGMSFRIRWRIDDHMGNGPSHQAYHDVRLLRKYLGSVSDLVEANDSDAESSRTKTIEP